MTTATADTQTAFDTVTINDPELERAVDAWEAAKNEAVDIKEKVKDKYQMVQSLLGDRELGEGSFRVGRWVLKLSYVSAHHRVRSKVART